MRRGTTQVRRQYVRCGNCSAMRQESGCAYCGCKAGVCQGCGRTDLEWSGMYYWCAGCVCGLGPKDLARGEVLEAWPIRQETCA